MFVGSQCYLCHSCATKRFQSICKTQIASFRIDKDKKWGIYFYSVKESPKSNQSIIHYKIYHILSEQLIHETETKTVGSYVYGNVGYSFYNLQSHGPYGRQSKGKANVVIYTTFDGALRFGKQNELDLTQTQTYKQIVYKLGSEINTF
eukprot:UN10212